MPWPLGIPPYERPKALSVTPVAGPVTRIWKGSNSLRAADMVTLRAVRGAWLRRTLTVAPATETVAAFAARGAAAQRRRRRQVIAWRIDGPRSERGDPIFAPKWGSWECGYTVT